MVDQLYSHEFFSGIVLMIWLTFVCFVMIFSLWKCSGANGGPFLSELNFFWPAVMIASAAFQAAASIIKVEFPHQ